MQGVFFLCNVTTVAILGYYVQRGLSTSPGRAAWKCMLRVAIVHKRNWPNLATGLRGKYKILRILSTFWPLAGIYCLNMTNPNNIFSKSRNFGAFFLQNPLSEMQWFFLCQYSAKISQQRNTDWICKVKLRDVGITRTKACLSLPCDGVTYRCHPFCNSFIQELHPT
jgi:hypothetical protein